MKKYLLILILVSFNFLIAQSNYQFHTEYMNGWYGSGVQMTNVTLGGNIYPTATLQAQQTGQHFVVEWDLGYNRWSNTNITLNVPMNLTWTGGGSPSDSWINSSITIGKYYTTKIAGLSYSNRQAVVMETSKIPVTISNIWYPSPRVGVAVPVTITLSGAKSNEELVYVRYTSDGWANSSFVLATGSGTSYSATIPGSAIIADPTKNQFYVLTTTVSAIDHATADLCTINLSNNNNLNYTLPVELSSFTANMNGRNVQLNWETKTEKNSNVFIIEKVLVPDQNTSLNGDSKLNWQNVGTVKAADLSNSTKSYSFTDNNLKPGKYDYRLKMVDNDGTYEYSNIVETDITLPNSLELNQNYPNPFNPTTKISYQLPSDAKVTLDVFNITGEKVAQLVNEGQSAGYYSYNFGTNRTLSSGIYYYRINAIDIVTGNVYSSVKKMMMIK